MKEYKKTFLMENAEPVVYRLPTNQILCNEPKTSDRHAWHGVAWIEYWQAFTYTYSNKLTCCCGKTIFANTKAYDARFFIDAKQDAYSETEDVQACGEHVYIPTKEGDEFAGGIYIAPLCKECNNRTIGELELKKGSLLFSEVGATVDKD